MLRRRSRTPGVDAAPPPPRPPIVERERRPLVLLGASLVAASAVAAVLLFLQDPPECVEFSPDLVGTRRFQAPPCMSIDLRDTLYVAVMETSHGPVRLLFDPILSPVDVNNIVFLARAGFYDNTTFHRIESTEDHALVQTGDPGGTGRGNAGYMYEGTEPSPIVRYDRGIVAMGNLGTHETNGSQFFIIVRDYDALGAPTARPRYSFVGIVADRQSLETLDRIVAVPLEGTKPVTPVRIERMTITEQPRSSVPDAPTPAPRESPAAQPTG